MGSEENRKPFMIAIRSDANRSPSQTGRRIPAPCFHCLKHVERSSRARLESLTAAAPPSTPAPATSNDNPHPQIQSPAATAVAFRDLAICSKGLRFPECSRCCVGILHATAAWARLGVPDCKRRRRGSAGHGSRHKVRACARALGDEWQSWKQPRRTSPNTGKG